MTKKQSPMCAKCPVVACQPHIKADGEVSFDKAPGYCPVKNMPDVIGEALTKYDAPDVREFARHASRQEFECYEQLPEGRRTKNPRIVELIQFARKCGYKKLGLAFCGGLRKEGQALAEILEIQGFEVVSVCCKVGGIPKERIGIKPEEKIAGPGEWESMCNPIAQAELLNAAKVDMAVMLGLCLGHDTLFIKYCRVPVTVIAVKDRVTGHSPLAPLYLLDTYYSRLKKRIE